MLHRTEGIVLKSSPYGEADLIVTFITRDMGIIKAFAKSPRKIKSRFGSSLEPFTYSKVSLWGREDSPMPRLTQSDIIRPFQGLRERLQCFLMLSEIAELTLALMPEGKANEKVFALFKEALMLMEGDCSRIFSLLYKIRLLELKGYAPALDGCARCGSAAQRFFGSQGSVICDKCAGKAGPEGGGGIKLSPGSIKLYAAMGRWELSRVPRIKASDAMLSELSGVLDSHIEHTLTKPLKTKGTYVAS
jgi:DNA repair protein RecO (recombination protein O)